jgi:hypothetical protein
VAQDRGYPLVDMSASNAWAEFAGLFRTTRAAFSTMKGAKTELKSLMPEDACGRPPAGAPLTYARRYALFTPVGIAGGRGRQPSMPTIGGKPSRRHTSHFSSR